MPTAESQMTAHGLKMQSRVGAAASSSTLSSPTAAATSGEDQPQEAKRCHLLEIPPEVRLRIYENVFADKIGLVASPLRFRVLRRDPHMNHMGPLLQTCKLIHREATPVMHKQLHSVQFGIHYIKDDSDEDDAFALTEDIQQRRALLCSPMKYISRVHIFLHRVRPQNLQPMILELEAISEILQDAESVIDMRFTLAGDMKDGKKHILDALESQCWQAVGKMVLKGNCSKGPMLMWRTLLMVIERFRKASVKHMALVDVKASDFSADGIYEKADKTE